MADAHHASCSWSPEEGFDARTRYGAVTMFEEGGQRAVELMLLSAAACLNFYLAEYVKTRNLPVTRLEVRCEGELVKGPTRIARIDTHIAIEGALEEREVRKMVTMCERACKVMNTLKQAPETRVHLELSPLPDPQQA